MVRRSLILIYARKGARYIIVARILSFFLSKQPENSNPDIIITGNLPLSILALAIDTENLDHTTAKIIIPAENLFSFNNSYPIVMLIPSSPPPPNISVRELYINSSPNNCTTKRH